MEDTNSGIVKDPVKKQFKSMEDTNSGIVKVPVKKQWLIGAAV